MIFHTYLSLPYRVVMGIVLKIDPVSACHGEHDDQPLDFYKRSTEGSLKIDGDSANIPSGYD
jgi:hypothetical protein